jgi:hypothetical protein
MKVFSDDNEEIEKSIHPHLRTSQKMIKWFYSLAETFPDFTFEHYKTIPYYAIKQSNSSSIFYLDLQEKTVRKGIYVDFKRFDKFEDFDIFIDHIKNNGYLDDSIDVAHKQIGIYKELYDLQKIYSIEQGQTEENEPDKISVDDYVILIEDWNPYVKDTVGKVLHINYVTGYYTLLFGTNQTGQKLSGTVLGKMLKKVSPEFVQSNKSRHTQSSRFVIVGEQRDVDEMEEVAPNDEQKSDDFNIELALAEAEIEIMQMELELSANKKPEKQPDKEPEKQPEENASEQELKLRDEGWGRLNEEVVKKALERGYFIKVFIMPQAYQGNTAPNHIELTKPAKWYDGRYAIMRPSSRRRGWVIGDWKDKMWLYKFSDKKGNDIKKVSNNNSGIFS